MNGEEKYLASCLDLARGPNKLSNRDLNKLRDFYTVQQALSQELLAAQPLGICKTCSSTNPNGKTRLGNEKARVT